MQPVVASPEQVRSLISYLRTLPLPQPGRQGVPDHGQPAEADTPETRPAALVNVADNNPSSAGGSNGVQDRATASDDTPTASADTPPGRGRQLFVERGCIACHGMDALGTRLAPSLIGVADKFPGDALVNLLRHPTSKMRDGGMPTVSVNEAQMSDLVAYLSSLRPVPAAPPNPQLNTAVRVATPQPKPVALSASQTAILPQVKESQLSPLAARGQRIFQRSACETCHGIGRINGTAAAPPLAGTASLLPESTLESMLRHHTARMERGGMPLTNFNTQDMKSIVAYIRSMTPAPEGRRLMTSELRSEKTNEQSLP